MATSSIVPSPSNTTTKPDKKELLKCLRCGDVEHANMRVCCICREIGCVSCFGWDRLATSRRCDLCHSCVCRRHSEGKTCSITNASGKRTRDELCQLMQSKMATVYDQLDGTIKSIRVCARCRPFLDPRDGKQSILGCGHTMLDAYRRPCSARMPYCWEAMGQLAGHTAEGTLASVSVVFGLAVAAVKTASENKDKFQEASECGLCRKLTCPACLIPIPADQCLCVYANSACSNCQHRMLVCLSCARADLHIQNQPPQIVRDSHPSSPKESWVTVASSRRHSRPSHRNRTATQVTVRPAPQLRPLFTWRACCQKWKCERQYQCNQQDLKEYECAGCKTHCCERCQPMKSCRWMPDGQWNSAAGNPYCPTCHDRYHPQRCGNCRAVGTVSCNMRCESCFVPLCGNDPHSRCNLLYTIRDGRGASSEPQRLCTRCLVFGIPATRIRREFCTRQQRWIIHPELMWSGHQCLVCEVLFNSESVFKSSHNATVKCAALGCTTERRGVVCTSHQSVANSDGSPSFRRIDPPCSTRCAAVGKEKKWTWVCDSHKYRCDDCRMTLGCWVCLSAPDLRLFPMLQLTSDTKTVAEPLSEHWVTRPAILCRTCDHQHQHSVSHLFPSVVMSIVLSYCFVTNPWNS